MARTPAKTLKYVRARVAAGAAYLDVMVPNWASKIDLAKLNLADGEACVIGQLAGEYLVEAVGLNGDREAGQLGFYLRYDEHDKGITYDALTRRWKKVIKERQALAMPF